MTLVIARTGWRASRRLTSIVALEAGRIVERGTHAALLAANAGYARMWALQQSSETAFEAN